MAYRKVFPVLVTWEVTSNEPSSWGLDTSGECTGQKACVSYPTPSYITPFRLPHTALLQFSPLWRRESSTLLTWKALA